MTDPTREYEGIGGGGHYAHGKDPKSGGKGSDRIGGGRGDGFWGIGAGFGDSQGTSLAGYYD